jgi:hypothetical protein
VESRALDAALDEQPTELRDDLLGLDTYLIRGLYAEQLGHVLDAFPRQRLLVLPSEELFARPAETVARVVAFLGLPPASVNVSRRFAAGRYEPASEAIRGRLAEFFRPHNERLYDLLGQDLGWTR